VVHRGLNSIRIQEWGGRRHLQSPMEPRYSWALYIIVVLFEP
jgi:hypothetical protein